MILRLMLRWGVRGALCFVVAFALLYVGDWAVFALRGAPRGTVTVEHTLVVPLKGNKQEFVDQGSVEQPCAKAVFGQSGLDPCWQLRRHPEQQVQY
jgi:hypothetical protein